MSSYVETNRGYITASKIKLFMSCPEAYQKVYIDEVDTSFLQDSESMRKGTLIDEYMLTRDVFDKKYIFPQGKMLKDDLIEMCVEKGISVDKKDTVDTLKKLLFGEKELLAQGDAEMLLSVERELKRQPLYDAEGQYECQREIVCDYRGLSLKAKIDRFSLEKGLVRDLKTSSDITLSTYHGVTKFQQGLMFDDKYQYGLQLAFYCLLAKIKYGKDFVGIVDGVKTSGTYASQFFMYSKEAIDTTITNKIIPALDLIADGKHGNDEIDRDMLIDNTYYPILDSAIQKQFITLE